MEKVRVGVNKIAVEKAVVYLQPSFKTIANEFSIKSSEHQ